MPARCRSDDTETIERALELTRDFTLAIDGGAHRGSWTTPLANRFRSVHAFEPAIDLFEKLVEKFANNKSVSLHNAGLFDRHGEGELAYPPGHQGKHRAGFVYERLGGSIPLVRLDDFTWGACGLLKLDIEGGEYAALCGGRALISSYRPVLVVECKQANASRHNWARADLDRWLAEYGYSLVFEAYPNLVFS